MMPDSKFFEDLYEWIVAKGVLTKDNQYVQAGMVDIQTKGFNFKIKGDTSFNPIINIRV